MNEPTVEIKAGQRGRLSVVDRLRAIDRVGWAVVAIFGVSLVAHLWGVGARAYHHDESQHAAFSYYFASGNGYRQDPLLHGPLQFHVVALIFRVLGDSDFTGRLFHALAGSLLVASPLLLRRTLGNTGTVLAAAFLLMSPSVLYYSRYARNDVPVALFTVMMFAGAWRYRADPRLRWLLLLSTGLGLSFASKETTYIAAAVLLLYLNAALAHTLFSARHSGTEPSLYDRLRDGIWLFPTAWIFAGLWRPLGPLRRRLALDDRPPEADVLLVVGTLVLAELAALVRIPLHLANVELDGPRGQIVAGIVVVLLLLAALVGWMWRWNWWIACAAVFFGVTVPLYMSMGTNVGGVGGLFWDSLTYWLNQQEVRRGTQPWFYYLMMVPLYEMLTLLPAALGGLWLIVRRRDHFAGLLLWWFGGTLLALSLAGEKMPWLTLHMALPLALLAAYVLGRAVGPARRHLSGTLGSPLGRAGASGAIVVLALVLVVTLRADYRLNVGHPDTPVEPLIYVQTTPEVPALAARIGEWIADGRASDVVLDDSSGTGITWPWAWYLRHEGIVYLNADQIARGENDPRSIVIRVHEFSSPPPRSLSERGGEVLVYHHRSWFIEDDYRNITWVGLRTGLLDGALPRQWARFMWDRGDLSSVASLDGEVYFPPSRPEPPGASGGSR